MTLNELITELQGLAVKGHGETQVFSNNVLDLPFQPPISGAEVRQVNVKMHPPRYGVIVR